MRSQQYAMIVWLLVITTGTLLGQQVRFLANIPKHTFLRVAPAPGDVQVVGNESTGIVRLHLRAADGVLAIPLIARSNSSYRLTGQGSEGIEVRVTAVKPFAGVEHLIAGSASVRLTGPVAVTQVPQTILEGPRISNGGNNSTADNALLIQVEVNSHDVDAELTLFMEPILTQ